jgi:hypothetical protein
MILGHTKCFIAPTSGGCTYEYGPDEYLKGEIFRDRESLERIRVRQLRHQVAEVEERAKVVELLAVKMVILQKSENRGSTDCTFV